MLRRITAAACASLALALPSAATWSIVVINTKTGEVGVAAATCLENFDLAKALPVVLVGRGGGVSQGLVDFSAHDRKFMWDGLLAGDKPVDILADLKLIASSVGAKQWGLADFDHAPAMWSGGGLGQAFAGSTGISGDLRYAVQGNVIAGPEVILAAATAVLATPGDLSQKLMAGMEAARALGGDGRCSCLTGGPTSCGVPPPGFTKSAHVAFAIVARIGDADGDCSPVVGCANGSYYLKLNVIGDEADPDPVFTLQAEYDVWRAALAGHPDHLLSTATAGPDLVADGTTTSAATVKLADVEGIPITHGGATITVTPAGTTTPHATPGTPTYVGSGTYSIPFTAGVTAGTDEFAIEVDDGTGPITLYPYLKVKTVPLTDLHLGLKSLSASTGGEAPFVLNLGPGAAAHPYILLGSLSGTEPGIPLGGGVVLPLNEDWFLYTTVQHAGSAVLPGSIGLLDGAGRAEAALVAGPGLLDPLVGLTIDWAAVDYAGPLAPTGTVDLDVEP